MTTESDRFFTDSLTAADLVARLVEEAKPERRTALRPRIVTPQTLLAAAMLGGLVLGACGMEQEPPPPDGLVLATQTADHVAGTFAQGGSAIDFDFTVAAGAHNALVTTHEGVPLIESVLANSIETVSFLERYTVTGAPGASDPQLAGDDTALGDLRDMPEAKLIQPLRSALADAGIEPTMYTTPKPTEAPYWSARLLQCGQHVAIPTYSWWSPVTLLIYSFGPATGSWHITDGLLQYNGSGNLDQYSDWSWWTIYVTNQCWYGAEALYVDSTAL